MAGKLIVGCEEFQQFARCFYGKTDQFSRFTARQQHAWLQLIVSKKFLEEELFGGTKFFFHKLVFDHKKL